MCWRGMKQRCTYEKHISYPHYGGRGIKVCPEWLESFDTFLTDMGEKPENAQLDRIDVDGDYTPENCRWSDASTNMKNRRKKAIMQSEHPGVSWKKRWHASIQVGCDSEQEAAELAVALRKFVAERNAQ